VEVWDRQELFLAAYARIGKRGRAAKEAGITVSCVEKWVAADVYGIRKRMEQAHHEYVESLEAEMDATIKSRPVATQVLQIFRLKAEAPGKYREEVKVIGMEASKQMMDRLRELAGKDLAQQAALEAPAVEAVYKEVPPPGPSPTAPSPAERPAPLARTEDPPAQPPSQMPPKESSSLMAAKDRRAAQFRASRAARARTPGRMVRR
jgi:hypothetical protein